MSKVVVGVFDNYEAAAMALEELKRAGFGAERISLVGPDTTSEMRPVVAEVASDKPDRFMTGMGIAGAIGGFLVGMTALAIPGTGALLVAGPVIGAISGAAAGSAIGVITGALVHFDVPETQAHLYEAKLSEGKVLIAVHTEVSGERARAEEILDRSGAIEVDTKAA